MTAAKAWGGPLAATARIEAGYRPAEHLELFGFAQADLVGVSGGAGARVTF